MRLAETAVFGGSGLDRAHALRGDEAGLQAARRDGAARAAVFWRGKPLLTAAPALARLPLDHPALAGAAAEPILLGREDGGTIWAVALDGWSPEGQPPPSAGFADPTEQRHPDLPDDHAFRELRAHMAALSPRDAELAATGRALLGWHATHRFCARCGSDTISARAGWHRLCPACGAQHFPRTDPVAIMLVTRGNSVLLGRSHGWPDGMFSLLAGFVEPGETLEAAVRREVAEETGVRVGAVRYLASQPWPFPASLMLGCEGTAETDEIRVDPEELEAALWLGREELVQVLAGLHPAIRAPRRGAIAEFLLRNWLADRLD